MLLHQVRILFLHMVAAVHQDVLIEHDVVVQLLLHFLNLFKIEFAHVDISG